MEQLRNQSFPSKSITEWKEKAEQSLKGKTVESLQSSTYENIILKPLYSSEDQQPAPDFPGGSDYRRGANSLGYVANEWKVAQKITFETVEELFQKLYEAFEKGQTVVSFDATNFEKNDHFTERLSELSQKYPFAINTKGYALLENLSLDKQVAGYVGADPISLFAVEGGISQTFLQNWEDEILKFNIEYPNLRTVLIDTIPYQNGGASAVQELGIAIAEGVHYLQQLIDKGMPVENAFSRMVFQFAIGGNFFMELAKLRAARIVWNKVAKVYGLEGVGMEIAAETASFTKTLHDAHVNLLRAGNEAFAAVLGGVQYLHVEPFDEISGSSSFSERVARNIQLILKEEAHLKKVIDPAGGSWYIETLTTQLAENSWAFFQEIQTRGGILETLKSNWLQREIAAVFEKRTKDIQTRKQSIVGTNFYADLNERIPNKKVNKNIKSILEKDILVEAVLQRRLAEPYEELRSRAAQLTTIPTVGMICLGEIKQYKPRLDFMKGFLAAGGIHTYESGTIVTVEEAKEFVACQNAAYFCFCGTNEQYETFGLELLVSLKSAFPGKTFFLAGVPENQTEWLEKGINKFIHVKSNCYETISEILAELEVAQNEA